MIILFLKLKKYSIHFLHLYLLEFYLEVNLLLNGIISFTLGVFYQIQQLS